MGEFWIACTTCHAHLKVRDASVIGQIVACPKCGSMVLVAAPAGAARAGQAVSTEPQPAAPTPAAVVPPPTPPAMSDMAMDDINDLVAGRAPEPARTSPAKRPTGATATSTADVVATDAPDQSATGSVGAELESAELTAPRPKWPQPLLLAGAGIVGLALAALVFVVVPRWFSGGTTSPGPSAIPTQGGTPIAQGDSGKPTGSDSPNTPPPTAPAEPTKPKTGEESRDKTPPTGAESIEPSSPKPDTPKPETSSDQEPPPAKPDKPSDESPVEAKEELPGPPELKPGTKSDSSKSGPQPVAGKFAQLLSGITPPSEEAPATASGEEKPTEPTATSEPAEGQEILRPRIREIDVPARLADPLTAIDFPSVALADYTQVLSDLSTLPITLDVDALLLRRLSPNTPIQIKLSNTTVRDALHAALEPLKLGFVAADGQVVISHPTPAEGAQRKRSHDVTDLVGNDPQQLTTLSQWVLELVEPETWSEAGGTGTLRAEGGALAIEQSDAAHLQVMLLCDKLRAARRLPPRGKFPPTLLNPDSLATRAQTALATPIKLNFARPTRLTQMLDRFGKIASVRIVVDWRALAEAGWPPETSATLTVENRPLADTLNQLLGPRDLTYRVVDDNTLQVTTPAAANRRNDWEFYSLADLPAEGFDAEAFIQRLQDAVGPSCFRANGGIGSVYYDAPSRCLLVALPQPQQRQVIAFLRSQS